MHETLTLGWRRIDVAGLELLELKTGTQRVRADSTIICFEHGGFRLDHAWELTPDWRTASLQIERQDADGRLFLALERDGAGWRVNGARRPDLDGADEPDLSVTPFSNTLAIRRMSAASSASLTIDAAYIDGKDLSIARSRQRYERRGPHRFRYFDLGAFAGFEADLHVDDLGLVKTYEHLFERVEIGT